MSDAAELDRIGAGELVPVAPIAGASSIAEDLLVGFEAIGIELGIVKPDMTGDDLRLAIKRTRNYIGASTLPVWIEPGRGPCALVSELRAYYRQKGAAAAAARANRRELRPPAPKPKKRARDKRDQD